MSLTHSLSLSFLSPLHRMLMRSCSSVTWVSLLSVHLVFLSLPHPLSLCLSVFTRFRGLTFTSARVLVSSTCRWARLPTRRHNGTTLCVCSRAYLGRVTTACVSSPRDWPVSIGSHMQQDMGTSKAPRHLGAPIPLLEYRSLQKTTIQKIGDTSS